MKENTRKGSWIRERERETIYFQRKTWACSSFLSFFLSFSVSVSLFSFPCFPFRQLKETGLVIFHFSLASPLLVVCVVCLVSRPQLRCGQRQSHIYINTVVCALVEIWRGAPLFFDNQIKYNMKWATYKSFPSAGPPLMTSEMAMDGSPLAKCGLSRPPETAIPKP